MEKLNQIRERNRIHAKTYYEKKRELILMKKKEYWQKIKSNALEESKNNELNYKLKPIIHEFTQPDKNLPYIDCSNNHDYDLVKQEIQNLDIQLSTKKKYIDDLKTLFRIINSNNLYDDLKDHEKIIQLIENSKQIKNNLKDYSINTKKGLFQLIVYLIDNLHIPLNDITKKTYKEIFEIYKQISYDQNEVKVLNELEPCLIVNPDNLLNSEFSDNIENK